MSIGKKKSAYNPAEGDWPVQDMSDAQSDAYRRGQGQGSTKLFDITCTIGSVYQDPNGRLSPRQTAFVLIADYTAEASAPGTFSFPNEDGSMTYVTVEHERRPE